MGVRRTWTCVAALAALVAIVAAAPAMGRGDPAKVTVAKHEGGPYVYDSPPATVGAEPESFWMRIASKADYAQDVTLEDRSNADVPGNVKFRWYRGDENITADAQGSGYEFKLKPDRTKIFRAKVKPLVEDPGEICLFGAFLLQPDDLESYGFFYINSDSICG